MNQGKRTRNGIRRWQRRLLAGSALSIATVFAAAFLASPTHSAPLTIDNGDVIDLLGGVDSSRTGLVLIDGSLINGDFILSGAGESFDVRKGLISARIYGFGSLFKTTGDVVTLSGANAYSGGSFISDGTLKLEHNTALGLGTLVATGGSLDLVTGLSVVNTIELQTADFTINVNGGTAQLSGIIREETGSFGFTKTGGGNLRLTGANTFTGQTFVNAGELTIANPGALVADVELVGGSFLTFDQTASYTYDGVVSGTGRLSSTNGELFLTKAQALTNSIITINPNATITLDTLATLGGDTNRVEILGGGTLDLGSTTQVLQRVELFGVDALASNGVLDVTTLVGLYRGSISADITGTGIVRKDTFTDAVVLSGNNSYTGATEINLGTLIVQNGNAIGDTSDVAIALPGTLQLDANETIGALSGAGSVNLQGFSLTTGRDAFDSTFSGLISGTGGLVKANSGKLTLTGANSYSGGTTIAGGTLRIEDSLALGTGAITTTGSVLDYANGVDLLNPINLNSNETQLQVLTGTATQSGVISETLGPRPIEKIGAGTLIFNAANTYTGQTRISGGTLALTVNGTLGINSEVVVSNGATLNLGGMLRFIDKLTLVDGTAGNGALIATNGYEVSNGSISASIGGSGGLTKNTTGTVTLSGNNAFTGAVSIQDGVLEIQNGEALSDLEAVTVDVGGTLSALGDPDPLVFVTEKIGSLAGAGSLVVAENAIVDVGRNNADTTFSGVMSGAGNVWKYGTGTMTLSDTNTIARLSVLNGKIVLADGNAIADTSTVFINNSGIVELADDETIGDLQVQTSGIADVGANDLTVLTGYAFGDITGSGKLIKSGSGSFSLFSLGGPKSITGGVEVTDGTLSVDINTTPPTAAFITAGGVITMSGNSTLEYAPGRGPLSDAIVLNSASVNLKIQGNNAFQGGVISDDGNNFGFTKTGTVGSLTLLANNTYTGATIAAEGALRIGGGGTTGSVLGDIVAQNGALVYFNRSDNVTFANKLSGGGAFLNEGSGILTLSSTLSDFTGSFIQFGSKTALTSNAVFGNPEIQVLDGSEFDLGGSTQSATFLTVRNSVVKGGMLNLSNSLSLQGGEISANIGGSGALMLSFDNSADTILSGANTYAGRLQLDDGTVRLRGGNALNDVVDARVASGALLVVEESETLDMLSGAGTVEIAATKTLSVGGGGSVGGPFDNRFSGDFTGGGVLRKTGVGTQVLVDTDLTALNSLVIVDGTLALEGTAAVGATVVELSGGSGTFDISALTAPGIDIDVIFGGGGINLGGKLLTTGGTGFDTVIGGIISGAGGALKKTGGGVLILAGNNTFDGGIEVEQGTLRLASSGAAGTGPITTTGSVISYATGVNNTAPIVINSATTQLEVLTGDNATQSGVISEIGGPRPLEKIGGGFLALSATNTYTGLTTITDGRLQLIGAGTVSDTVNVAGLNAWLDFVRADTYTYGGVISGTSISQQGTGTLILTGANTHTWTGISDGTLRLDGAGTLGAANVTVALSGVGPAPATLDLNGTTQNIGILQTFQGWTQQVIGGTLNVSTFILPEEGLISANLGGAATLVKNTNGTTTLSGTNTYTGQTTINGGTLVLQGGNAIANSGSVSGSGGVLQINNSEQIFSLSGAFDTTLNANLLIDGTATTTYSGVISGAGGLYHYGAGTLTLTGASTYAGGTTISGGTIILGGANGEIVGDVLVDAGATLEFNRSNSLSFGGVISGAGTVKQNNPSGVITLTGVNTLQGAVIVTNGTLGVSGVGTFGDGASVTLSASGSNATVDLGGTSKAVFRLGVDQGATVTGAAGSELSVVNAIDVGFGSISVDLSGNAGLNKITGIGGNAVTLSGTNTFTGTTQVAGGTLVLQGGAALADTNLVVVSAGATLQVDASETIRELINNGDVALGANTLTLNYALQNIGTVSGTNTALVVVQGATNSIENLGLIESTGVGGIALQIVDPSGIGVFTGMFENSGTMRATNGTALLVESSVSGVIVNSGTLQGTKAINLNANTGFTFANSGTLTGDVDAQNGGTDTLRFTGGSLTGSLSTDATDILSVEGGSWNFGTQTIGELRVLGGNLTGGTISAGAFNVETGTIAANLSGAGGLSKSTGGTVTLSGTNTYSGPTTINGGTLVLQGGNAIPDGSTVNLSGGTTLRIQNAETIGALSGTGIVDITNPVNLTLGGSNLNSVFFGDIFGSSPGGIIKEGSGVFEITGNLFAAPVLVNTGEFKFNGTTSATVTVSSGAKLSGNSVIGGNLNLNSGGTLSAGNSPGTISVSGDFVGGGTLDVEVQFDNAGSPVNGTTHDFLTIAGNVSGAPTAVNLIPFFSSVTPAATTGNGIEVVRVGGTTSAADFTMTAYALGSYFYNLVYLPDYSGSLDGFFLQSSLITPGCVVDGTDNVCAIDDAANTLGAAVNALAGNDTLRVNGATDFTFDVGRIGTTYTNFEVFQKADANTVTLTGTMANANQGVDVQSGTLIAGTGTLGSSGRVNIFTPGSLQVASNLTIGSIAGSGDVALGSNTLAAGGDNTSTLFSGVVSGSGVLQKDGAGTLTLSGANTHTGQTSVQDGGITIAGSGTLGAATVSLFVQGTLDLGGTSQTVGSLGMSVGSIQNGALIVNGNGFAQDGTISADLTVTGNFSKAFGSGNLTLSGNNSLSSVGIGSGTLIAANDQAITDTATVNMSYIGFGVGPNLQIQSNQTIGSLSGDLFSGLNLGAFNLTTGGNNASTSFDGVISSSTGKLVKTGTGMLTLSGNNIFSFAGGINLMQGTLRLASDGAAGTGPITTFGSVIDYAADVTNAAPVVINSATTQFQVTTGTATQSGVISELSGPRPFEKIGAGELILSGTNTFTGATTITGGTLTAQGGAAIADLGAITVTSPGVLQLVNSETVGSVGGSGNVVLGANTLTTGGNGASTTLSGVISGAGGKLVKTGAGVFTLTGTNTFSGGIDLAQGTLRLGSNGAAGAGPITTLGAVAIDYATLITNAAPIVLGSNATQVQVATAATQSGVISETGGARPLEKTGFGTLFLSAANTYTGLTTVSQGRLQLTGNGALAGNVQLAAFTSLIFDRTTPYTYSGVISGAGSIVQGQVGTITLTGANTHAATTVGLGTLRLSGAGTLGASNAQVIVFGVGSTLDLGGTTQTIGSLQLSQDASNSVINGTLNVATSILTTDGTFGVNLGGTAGLTKSGTGTVILSGANTYSGATTIVDGTLRLQGGAAIADLGAITVTSPGVLQLANSETVGSVGGTGNVVLGANILTLGGSNASTTLSGVVSGVGGKLVKQGSGMLTLSGANTFTGGIDVFHGTLTLGSNTAAGTGPITTFGTVINYLNLVNNASPIVISSNTTQLQQIGGTATQSGAISEVGGSRPLEKIGNGNLTLSGTNTFTGPMTISDGTLTLQGGAALADSVAVIVTAPGALALNTSETVGSLAGSGNLTMSGGTALTAGGTNASTLFSGNMTGGGFTKSGSGNFTFTGTGTFGGPLNVNAGTFTKTGGGLSGASAFNTAFGTTTFLGATTAGVNGAGIAATGMGAIGINGTLYLDDNTTLAGTTLTMGTSPTLGVFLTTNTSVYPQITVSGAASVSGTLGVYLDPLTFSATPATTFTYDNVIAGSSRAGTFTAVNLLQSPSGLFSVAAAYGANDVDLTVTRSSFTLLGGGGGNSPSVGGAVEDIFVIGTTDPDLLNLISTIGASSPSAIAAIYAALSGSTSAETTGGGLRTDDPWKQTVAERINAARAPGCTVAGETWCLRRYAQAPAPVISDVQGNPSAFDWLETGIRDAGTQSAWLRAVGSWSQLDGSDFAAGSKQLTGGFIGGIDHVFNSLLLAGVAGQYLETSADFDNSRNGSHIRSAQLGAYLSYGGAEAYVNANASMIGTQARSERFATVGLVQYEIDSFMRGLALTASAEAGTILEFDGYRFEPSVALNYQYGKTDDYAERGGGGLSLLVRPDDSESLRSVLTARLSRVFDAGDRKIVPQIRLDWRHEHLDRGQSFTAAFAGAPTVLFDVEGTPYARDQFTVGAGVTVPIAGRLSGYADALSTFSEDTTAATLLVGVRATW